MDSKAVQRSALCRSRREFPNEYLLAKFGFNIAENEPCKVFPLSAYRSLRLDTWIEGITNIYNNAAKEYGLTIDMAGVVQAAQANNANDTGGVLNAVQMAEYRVKMIKQQQLKAHLAIEQELEKRMAAVMADETLSAEEKQKMIAALRAAANMAKQEVNIAVYLTRDGVHKILMIKCIFIF